MNDLERKTPNEYWEVSYGNSEDVSCREWRLASVATELAAVELVRLLAPDYEFIEIEKRTGPHIHPVRRIGWSASRTEYSKYILSAEWKDKAASAKFRANYRCQVCNATEQLQAHHRTYERLGNELPEDITVLCDDCHRMYHEAKKLKPVKV